MVDKGGPPDLDEVFKSITNKMTMRNKDVKKRRSGSERSHPFPTQDDQTTRVDITQSEKKKRSIPFFIYIVLAFFLYNLGKGFFGGALDTFNERASISSSIDSPLPAGFSFVESIQNFFGELNMNETMGFATLIGGVILLILFFRSFVRIVPQNEAFVVERLGKYNRTLLAGFHITIPILERVAYKHSLKEYAIDVASQHAITRDNVVLGIDGVLYLKIMDAQAASYGIENLQFAIVQLAQTSMRAEIGKLSLDDTFESRENINAQVTRAIDEASEAWGTKVLRYEVKDITPPASILEEMEKQMGAERQRRVAVTTSEGYRTAQINEADGDKQAQVLRAQGSAESMTIEATAKAEAIRTISEAINSEGGSAAVAQQLAEQYVAAFDKLAREGTIALLPGDGTDVASMVAKAYTAFDGLKGIVGANKPNSGNSDTTFTGS